MTGKIGTGRLLLLGAAILLVAGLTAHISENQAAARDYYALAKAYLYLRDATKSRTSGNRAMDLHQQEQRAGGSTLSGDELADLREWVTNRQLRRPEQWFAGDSE